MSPPHKVKTRIPLLPSCPNPVKKASPEISLRPPQTLKPPSIQVTGQPAFGPQYDKMLKGGDFLLSPFWDPTRLPPWNGNFKLNPPTNTPYPFDGLDEPAPCKTFTPLEALRLYQAVRQAGPEAPDATDQLVDLLVALLNNVESADLDLYNVPYNRGLGLHRYPEYTPAGTRPTETTLRVEAGTTARMHGEIRPVRGSRESIISRWTIDFTPDVTFKPQNLLIDGFEAVDHPDGIVWDKTFKSKKPLLDLPVSDYDYEKFLGRNVPLQTPFNREVDPPPEGHRDWMIRFQPVTDSLVAGFKEAITDGVWSWTGIDAIKRGEGTIILWAILPTLGLQGESHYEKLGIRFNSLPRRFGDLIALFRPYFHADWRGKLKHNAPYINPNSEYIGLYVNEEGKLLPLPESYQEVQKINDRRKADCEARPLSPVHRKIQERIEKNCSTYPKPPQENQCLRPIGRQRIPEGPYSEYEICKINQERAYFGKDPVTRNRGSVVDWIFTDMAKFPERLAKMKELPYGTARFKMRSATLPLSAASRLHVDGSTQFNIYYYIKPVTVADPANPKKKKVESRIGARITFKPLSLSDMDLGIGRLRVEKLQAEEVILDIPSIPGLDQATPETRPPMTLHLKGIRTEGLKIEEPGQKLEVGMAEASIQNIKLVYGHNSLKATVRGIVGKGFAANKSGGGFHVDSFEIPELRLAQSFYKEGERPQGTGGLVPKITSVVIPKLKSGGNLEMNHEGSQTHITLSGDSTLEDFKIFNNFQGSQNLSQGSVKLSGVIHEAKISNPKIGTIEFSTKENGSQNLPISGNISTPLHIIEEYEVAGKPPPLDMKLNLPYVGFSSSGIFNIPKGSSTLREGHLSLNFSPQLTGSLEGKVDVQKGSFNGLSQQPWELGRFIVEPMVSQFATQGDLKFEVTEDGFRLTPRVGSTGPLNLEFAIDGSRVSHLPNLNQSYLAGIPESRIIQSLAELTSAKFRVAALDKLEVHQVEEDGVKRNKVVLAEGGPFTAHHIRANATLWADLPVFRWVRGLFPSMGAKRGKDQPDPAPLTRHMSPEERRAFLELVGDEDFLHVGKISFVSENQDRLRHIEDLMVNFHEEGGRQQYGMLRLPEIYYGEKSQKPLLNLGTGGILVNIFLKDGARGGYFYFERWPLGHTKMR